MSKVNQQKVNAYLNKHPNQHESLFEEFRDLVEYNPKFAYKRNQFRMWVWNTWMNVQGGTNG